MNQVQGHIYNEVVKAFDFPGELIGVVSYGKGHINDTNAAYYQLDDDTVKRFIIQQINTHVFHNPDELMDNIIHVTEFLRKKIVAAGGDPERETLNVIRTKDHKTYYKDCKGDCFRAYVFIENATTYQSAENADDFYNAGKSFGTFQRLLADYPANTLYETIEHFHDTKKRFSDFTKAVEENVSGRAADVAEEIAFVRAREKDASVLVDLLKKGELPLRVTHNDTKLNNVMIDRDTGKGICIVDLDTVMPGLSLYDYGDSIRFGASTAAEDETDLNKVSMDLGLFEAYTKGFLEACGTALTPMEIKLFPMGAKLMTYECGMRFLADHIAGDVYFRIHRENHNLDRARTQFKLVADMEQKWERMHAIVEKACREMGIPL